MKKLIALPTWVMTMIMIPFLPKTHPWHCRHFTLEDWYVNATPDCRQFDLTGWMMLICVSLVLAFLKG